MNIIFIIMKQCVKCNKEFKTTQKLNNHLNRKIKCDNKIECPDCKKIFITKQKLERHLNKKKNCKEEKLENTIERIELKHTIDKLKNNNEIVILELKNKILELQNNILELNLQKQNEIKILKIENNKLKEIINEDKYINGIIYKIEYSKDPKIKYIGSTTKSIKTRFASHKNKYNRWLLNDEYGKCEIYEYFKMYGIENFNITSLGEYKIINKNHLLAYEQLWMNKLENINLNKAFTPINITKHLSKINNKK
jgi:hypothetical protein